MTRLIMNSRRLIARSAGVTSPPNPKPSPKGIACPRSEVIRRSLCQGTTRTLRIRLASAAQLLQPGSGELDLASARNLTQVLDPGTMRARRVRPKRLELADRAPHAEPDPFGELIQPNHAVREEDHDAAIIWIGLPPAAVGARPTYGACATAAPQWVGFVRFHHHCDAHAKAVTRGEDRRSKHFRGGALVIGETV